MLLNMLIRNSFICIISSIFFTLASENNTNIEEFNATVRISKTIDTQNASMKQKNTSLLKSVTFSTPATSISFSFTIQNKNFTILSQTSKPEQKIFVSTTKLNIISSTYSKHSNNSIEEKFQKNSRFPSPISYTTSILPSSTTTLTTILVKRVEDYHKYYKSTVLRSNALWVSKDLMLQADKHHSLSESYRSAATITLSFPFYFYGHLVNQVTIATGGFLYMSEFLHQWLTATQYIAPLMANFDTQIGNSSHIRYLDDGDRFVVWWQNIHLQDDPKGHYSFQAQLYNNGTIVFCYKQIPHKNPLSISSSRHPVKVGLSDAYYMDKPTNTDMKQRTIYEYHRVEVNMSLIENNTTVIITPLPSCLQHSTCRACVNAPVEQRCQWCAPMGYCSDGMDRRRQEWLHYGCNKQYISRSDRCSLSSWSQNIANKLASANVVASLFLMGLFTLLMSCVVAWFVYAYKHPSSRSGIWLIEHHPAQLKNRLQGMLSGMGKNTGNNYSVAMQPEVESLAQM